MSVYRFSIFFMAAILMFIYFILRANPPCLFEFSSIIVLAPFIFYISFSFSREIKNIFVPSGIAAVLITLGCAVLYIYSIYSPFKLNAPPYEYVAAAVIIIILSLAGSAAGFMTLPKASRASVFSGDPAALRIKSPQIKWISYNQDLSENDNGTIDVSKAGQIIDQYLSRLKSNYEYAEDVVDESCFRFEQEKDTFLEIEINSLNEINAALQIERRDISPYMRLFKKYFSRELTLKSRDELVSLVETFFGITPENFMTQLSRWTNSKNLSI